MGISLLSQASHVAPSPLRTLEALPDCAYVRIDVVRLMVGGIARSTPKASAWRLGDVRAYLNSRKQGVRGEVEACAA